MKKGLITTLTTVAMATVMVFTFAGCGGSSDQSEQPVEQETVTAQEEADTDNQEAQGFDYTDTTWEVNTVDADGQQGLAPSDFGVNCILDFTSDNCKITVTQESSGETYTDDYSWQSNEFGVTLSGPQEINAELNGKGQLELTLPTTYTGGKEMKMYLIETKGGVQ